MGIQINKPDHTHRLLPARLAFHQSCYYASYPHHADSKYEHGSRGTVAVGDTLCRPSYPIDQCVIRRAKDDVPVGVICSEWSDRLHPWPADIALPSGAWLSVHGSGPGCRTARAGEQGKRHIDHSARRGDRVHRFHAPPVTDTVTGPIEAFLSFDGRGTAVRRSTMAGS